MRVKVWCASVLKTDVGLVLLWKRKVFYQKVPIFRYLDFYEIEACEMRFAAPIVTL